ncbi:MAG: LPS assembly protein LptD [Pseudomonadota bacterium]
MATCAGASALRKSSQSPLRIGLFLSAGFISTGVSAQALTDPEDTTQNAIALARDNTAAAALSDPNFAVDPTSEEEVLFEADLVTRVDTDSPIIASGDVRAYFGKRYLRADRLEYYPDTDVVIADGNVAITDEGNETIFAGRFVLSGDLRDGIADSFTALLEDNARLGAETAIQEQGARTRLSRAVYTACNVCNSRNEAKIPTWRVKALRITRDRERKVVRFRHAFVELKGVPILYTPYIQGPDPSVERQSGFLTPQVGASSRQGFNFELPYYFAFSNSTDATLFPRYTGEAGTLWQAEFRRKGRNSSNVFSGGIIDSVNNPTNDNGAPLRDIPGVRWNIFARGYRDFGPNWQLGYDVERVSDDTFLRNFNVRRRGDLRLELDVTRSNRLRSNSFARWRKGNSKLNIDSYLFQGLQASDNSALTPYVLPLLDFQHDLNRRVGGGRISFNANLASLQRTGGVDTRRFTASVFWRREHTTKGGHRFNAFAEARGDGFLYADLNEGTELTNGDPIEGPEPGDNTRSIARFAPTVGVEWSYPLTRRGLGGRLFLEPRVQLLASPANRNPDTILNEDSLSVEFDYAGLFEFNKAPGFDRFEDGQRMNVGLAASAIFDAGLSVETSIGSQFRLQATDAFDTSTGLGETRSDIVGSLNVRYRSLIGMENRFRISDDTGSLERVESLAYLNFWRFSTSANYVRLSEEQVAAFQQREELLGRVGFRMTKNWRTRFDWRQDLTEGGGTINQTFSLTYTDECSSFALLYRRDLTQDIGLEPNNAFLVQFTLRSLVD